jgi:hypothetical protein
MSYAAIVLLVLLSLSFTSFYVTEAHAQSCIELIGSKWSKTYVGVYIASGTNEVQRRQVLFALQIWLAAQNWFIDSFEQGAGTPWLLYLTDRADEGAISVSFFIGQGVDFGGRAIWEGTGERFSRVRVQINLPPDRAGNPHDLYVESVILHELGHAMGLGHTHVEVDAMGFHRHWTCMPYIRCRKQEISEDLSVCPRILAMGFLLGLRRGLTVRSSCRYRLSDTGLNSVHPQLILR